MTGLVLEGGGHRGIYTAGVLDVLLENKITVDGVIGVSAGAIHGSNFVSHQVGRSVRYTEKYCSNPSYMGLSSFLKTGDLFNTEFCYRTLPEFLDPFDYNTFARSKIPYYVVVTDIKKGEPVYHKCKTLKDENMDWLRASASMPLVSKPVEIKNKLYFDGGVTDSIPVAKFEELGFNKNIVVLTQPKGYSKKPAKLMKFMEKKYKDYPEFLEAMKRRHEVYNQELEYIEQQENAENAFIIRPSSKPLAGRLERDSVKIRLTYELGRRDAIQALNNLKCFLNPSY